MVNKCKLFCWNKRGLIKVIEATIAVMIILGALAVMSMERDTNRGIDIAKILPPILDEIAKDPLLREQVMNYNLLDSGDPLNAPIIIAVSDFLNVRIGSSAFDFRVSICSLDDICYLDPYPSDAGDIFAAERVVSTSLENSNFEPRKVKVFLWRKGGTVGAEDPECAEDCGLITGTCTGAGSGMRYTGACSGGSCATQLAPEENTLALCTDGLDNDCMADGVDGADAEGDCMLRVFITSSKYSGNLGGENADTLCQQTASGLGASSITDLETTWMAWISSIADSPNSRFTVPGNYERLGYKRLDDLPVSNSWSLLKNYNLLNPILIDENGEDISYCSDFCPVPYVWTATDRSGDATEDDEQPYLPLTCNSWTSSAISEKGHYGKPEQVDSDWSASYGEDGYDSFSCDSDLHIYCFEQPS